MTPGDESGAEPLMIHQVTSRKRRRGFDYSWFIAAVVVLAIGAGAAYMVLGKAGGPLEVKPQGVASLSAAEACYRDHDYACTEADYEAYLQKYPNDSLTNARLALVLTHDGRHKEALQYYRKAESLGGSGTYDFYAGYAESLEATGDLDGAIEKNRASLKIVPTLVDVRGSLANELVRKGKSQEAIELLESFDRTLEDEGEQPYFTSQIEQIKAKTGGGASAAAGSAQAGAAAALQGVTHNGVSEINLERGNGALYVPVLIDNALTLKFIVDSGATDVTISSDVAATLTRMGKLSGRDYLGHGEFILADGSHVPSQLFIIRSLKVGDRELHDVTAVITNSHGSLLLGQSFLRRFKSWSIDNHRGVLVLTD